jgi:hypothetical protein
MPLLDVTCLFLGDATQIVGNRLLTCDTAKRDDCRTSLQAEALQRSNKAPLRERRFNLHQVRLFAAQQLGRASAFYEGDQAGLILVQLVATIARCLGAFVRCLDSLVQMVNGCQELATSPLHSE